MAADLLPSTVDLGQSGGDASLLPSGPSLDASAIDLNLRAIRSVQSSWRLPEIPDEVQLDLASIPNLSTSNLQSFLYGLEADLHGEDENSRIQAQPEAPALSVVPSVGQFSPIATTGFQEASAMISTLRGQPPSSNLDANAVQRWKLRAIEKGYLDAPSDGVVDGTWSPELYGIQRKMQFDDYDSVMRGARFGAMPLTTTDGHKGLLETLYDWTSPSGLMRAAVDLDLFWDFGQVGKEFSSWGDKWSKVGESKNPLDFGKNLLDALTGPIDDIVVPVVNMALLWTGLGVGTNFARLGATGALAAESADIFRATTAMYRVPGIGSVARAVFPEAAGGAVFGEAVGELKNASMLANRLSKGAGMAKRTGDALAAWRNLDAVAGARGVVQTGMRLGLVSQAEQRLLPNYKGGFSLSDVPAVRSTADHVLHNPWITTVGEALFTPYTMMPQGFFVNNAKRATLGAGALLGTTAGRTVAGGLVGVAGGVLFGDGAGDIAEGAAAGAAAGAFAPQIGNALEWVGGKKIPIVSQLAKPFGAVAKLSQWETLGRDQRLTNVFYKAVRSTLEPEQIVDFEKSVAENGFLKTLSARSGMSEEQTSAAMGYVLLSASIDRTAALQAGGGARNSAWYERYFLARNKLASQVRVFNEDSTTEDVAWAILRREHPGNQRTLRARWERYMEAVKADVVPFSEAVDRHNEQALLTMRQLLSPDNLPVDGLDEISQGNMSGLLGAMANGGPGADHEALVGYVAEAMKTFGDWGKYTPAMTELNTLVSAGHFADVQLAPAFGLMGQRAPISFLEATPEWLPKDVESEFGRISEHLHDLVFLDQAVSPEAARQAGFYYNPLAREVNPWRSKLTLMRSESVSKQELMIAADKLKRVKKAYESMWDAARAVGTDGAKIIDDPRFLEYTSAELNQILRTAGISESNSAKAVRRAHTVLQHAKDEGADLTGSLDAAMRRYADDLDTSPVWGERFGQSRTMLGESKDGTPKALSGFDALHARRKDLLAQAKRTAAEVDREDLLAKVAASAGTDSEQYQTLERFFRNTDAQGYKVVYGQEFLMPNDVQFESGLFDDITTKHLNAVTLGNFFGKRHPLELAANVQQARARSIASRLSEVVGRDLRPDDPMVHDAVSDLYHLVLDPELARNHSLVSDVAHQSIMDKGFTAGKVSGSVRGMQDLGLLKNESKVIEALKIRWSEQEAKAIWRGLKEGRYAEWKDQGLYAIEAKLRGRNQFIDSLHVLGGSPNAKLLRRAMPGAVAGAAVGGRMNQASLDDGASDGEKNLSFWEGALVGGLIGGAGRVGLGKGLDQAEKFLESKDWAKYGYLVDGLAQFRDRMRFSLSPFFDASRFTEAFTLGFIAAPKRGPNGERLVMPLNMSPSKLQKKIGNHEFQRLMDDWHKVSKGMFDLDALEQTGRQFEEVGLLGFNPTKWMASTFHHMRQQGLTVEKSYEAVKEMYTYGVRSRSPFEQSVNFIFFPFSFQKKVMTHAAQWISDDLMRSVMLHDMQKAYEVVADHTGIDDVIQEHLPILNRLSSLNALAFGLSPGRLGGVNAPFVDALVGNPFSDDPERAGHGLLSPLFGPIGLNVGQGINSDDLMKLVKRTIPAINDVTWLIEDAKEQGHVLFDPSHQTRASQARDAFAEWSEYKKGVEAALQNAGASWYDLHNNPGLIELKAQYETKKNDLERQYPGWVDAKLRAAEKNDMLDQERQFRLNTVMYNPQDATPSDLAFYQFETYLEQAKTILDQQGTSAWEDMSPAQFAEIRGVGIEMARQNPGFRLLWRKFYAKVFGPIESEVRP